MSNSDALRTLQPGIDLKLFADPVALQAARFGLITFGLLCAAVAVYLLAKQIGFFGASSRSAFGWVGVVLAGLAAFLLQQKAMSFKILDDTTPLLTITATALEYDTRRDGWRVNWQDVTAIELEQETVRKKQSVPQTTSEVHVRLREGAGIAWTREDIKLSESKTLYEKMRYLVINPEPLGVSHEELATALERYHKGL